jgi:hypothetical protein
MMLDNTGWGGVLAQGEVREQIVKCFCGTSARGVAVEEKTEGWEKQREWEKAWVAMLGWERAGGVVLPRFHVFMVVSVVSVTPRIRGFGLIKQPEEESFPCRTLA